MKYFMLVILSTFAFSFALADFKTTISPDGRFFVREASFVSDTGTLAVYETASGKLIYEKKLKFNGSCLIGDAVVVSQPERLSVLSLSTGLEIVTKPVNDKDSPTGLACDNAKNLVAVGISEGPIEILNVSDLSLVHSINLKEFPTKIRYKLNFSKSGDTLLVMGDSYSPVFFLDTASGTVRAKTGVYYSASAADFNENGALAAVSFHGNQFVVFSSKDGKPVFEFPNTAPIGKSIPKFYRDKLVVAGMNDQFPFLKAFSISTFSLLWDAGNLGNWSITSFDVSEKFNQILVGTNTLYFVDPNSGIAKPSQCYALLNDWIFSQNEPHATTPDGSHLGKCDIP